MLRHATRRYKLGNPADSEFKLNGGILQGCPFSMIAMNAVVNIWPRVFLVRNDPYPLQKNTLHSRKQSPIDWGSSWVFGLVKLPILVMLTLESHSSATVLSPTCSNRWPVWFGAGFTFASTLGWKIFWGRRADQFKKSWGAVCIDHCHTRVSCYDSFFPMDLCSHSYMEVL